LLLLIIEHSNIMYVIHEYSFFFVKYTLDVRGRSSLKESFVEGVEEFVTKASQQDCYHINGGSDVHELNVIVLGFWRV